MLFCSSFCCCSRLFLAWSFLAFSAAGSVVASAAVVLFVVSAPQALPPGTAHSRAHASTSARSFWLYFFIFCSISLTL